jgi:hypothetical protein
MSPAGAGLAGSSGKVKAGVMMFLCRVTVKALRFRRVWPSPCSQETCRPGSGEKSQFNQGLLLVHRMSGSVTTVIFGSFWQFLAAGSTLLAA